MNYRIGDKMVEKIEKVVNHRLVVFDREKFEMLKETIEKIMAIFLLMIVIFISLLKMK